MQRYFIRTEHLTPTMSLSAALLLISFGRVRYCWQAEALLDIVRAPDGSFKEWYALAVTVNDDDMNIVDAYLAPEGLAEGLGNNDELIELSYSELLALCAAFEKPAFSESVGKAFGACWNIERRGIIPPRRIVIVDENGRDIAEVRDKKTAQLMVALPGLLEKNLELSAVLRDTHMYGHANAALASASRVLCGLASKEK